MEPRRPVITPANPADWQSEILLRLPLMVDGVLLASLSPRAITGNQLVELLTQGDSEIDLKLRAYALVAGVHPDVLGQLSADDYVEVLAAIRPFLPQIVLDEASPGEDAVRDAVTGGAD